MCAVSAGYVGRGDGGGVMLPDKINFRDSGLMGIVTGVSVSRDEGLTISYMTSGEVKQIRCDTHRIGERVLKSVNLHQVGEDHILSICYDLSAEVMLYFSNVTAAVYWYRWLIEYCGDVEWKTEGEIKEEQCTP